IIDVDSPVVIVDGRIVENPHYKFRRGAAAVNRMREDRVSRAAAPVYEPTPTVIQEVPEPVAEVMSDTEQVERISSEGYDKVEMKIGDVQIKFWKKDTE
ncbi:MAG: hypothetical protein J5822_09255, partial [Eubacteriaceae bacterium]|nr:hypothetical protein [Eubacteriaceae bacterium]